VFYKLKATFLKAGALYYAIFISFIIALSCTVMMLNSYLHQTYVIQYLQAERLDRNINSALVLLNEDPSLVKLNEQKPVQLFDDELDEVMISRKSWGVFDILTFSAEWKNIAKFKMALVGNNLAESRPIALYLADQERYLSVSGRSLLKGDCYLPALGVRRAYIEGKSFMGVNLIEGKSEKSSKELPNIDQVRLKEEIQYIKGKNSASDSMVSGEVLAGIPSVKRSFGERTLTFQSNNWIYLSNQSLEGNIRVVSAKGISVDNTTQLNNVLIYAPKVIINKEFKGSVQVFATDTVIVREECTFLSPSALTMVSSIEKPVLNMDEDCIFKGDIIVLSDASTVAPKTIVSIAAKSRIEGQLYINGSVELKGSIYGSLYCDGFILRTPSALYENHLLDAVVDFTSLSKYYTGSAVFPVNLKSKRIRWLE
jgi:cytoskeletal protein CcmA (bactofilin family)